MEQLPAIDRERFLLKLGAAVQRARQDGSCLGLLLIDLTNLARINHLHGYQVGDGVLVRAHDALVATSKLPDSVFRVGGHRFAFILEDLGNPAFIALALNRVERLLGSELHVDADALGVDVKTGIVLNRQGGREPLAMLALAEASLANVKMGRGRRIEDILAEESEEPANLRLEQQLTEALQDNAFELYFQPKVAAASGEVRSVEALLRWRSPDGVAVSPQIIVDWAQATGRSYELTKWVVHRSLRQLKAWQGSLGIGVAINVPANLAADPDLPSMLHDAIAIWGVPPGQVTVEITESAVMEDKESGHDNLLRIKNMGVNISIDDFGTGFSSLSYFKHIPAAELKIDKSFVDSMLSDEQDLELVKIILHIGHQFGLRVVAEGVEDRHSLEVLRKLGCDFIQGYHVSPPLPREDLETWLAAWPGFPPQDQDL